MFGSLLSIVGDFAKLKVDVSDLWKGFSLKQEVRVAVESRGVKQERKYFATDGRTALGIVPVHLVAPVDDPRGMNNSIIGENGYVDPELFVAKVKFLNAATRPAQLTMAAAGDLYVRRDSQISLLVSMLSSYFTMTYKEAGSPVYLRDYDDGHLKMSLLDIVAPAPQQGTVTHTALVDHQGWQQQHTDSEPNYPVLGVYHFTERDIKILLAHLGGRARTTRLAFDLEIPPLAECVLLSGASYSYDTNEVPEYSSRDVRLALDKYVMTNRLDGAFSAAMAIMHQVAFNPLPDTAEGYAWLTRGRALALPSFDSWRGAYRFLVGESPYGLDTYTSETWKWWRECGLSTCVPAANLTALSLWGRYLAEGQFYHDDADIHRLGTLDFRDAPSAAYYAYAALLTGHDVHCPVPRTCGLSYAPWEQTDEHLLPVALLDADSSGYNIITRGSATYIDVDDVPPPCSAVHILGRMPEDSAFTALCGRFSVTTTRMLDSWRVENVNQAWGLAMITRWCGFDVEMEYRGKLRRANWAPNQSSIAARPFSVHGPDRWPVELKGYGAREKIFMQLPPLDGDVNVWTAEVAVSPNVSFLASDMRPVMSRSTFMPPRAMDMTVAVPTDADLSYMKIVLQATRRVDLKLAGFHVLGRSTAHEPADPTAIPSDVPPNSDEQLDLLEGASAT